jgi:hypothetical protein
MSAIIMTEEYWATSPFSIARYYGGIKVDGVDYVIVNKEGKDIYECSIEAEKAGREKAIEPGEPADLVNRRYVPMYKRLGRDQFIEWVKEGLDLTAMKKRLKEEKK